MVFYFHRRSVRHGNVRYWAGGVWRKSDSDQLLDCSSRNATLDFMPWWGRGLRAFQLGYFHWWRSIYGPGGLAFVQRSIFGGGQLFELCGTQAPGYRSLYPPYYM